MYFFKKLEALLKRNDLSVDVIDDEAAKLKELTSSYRKLIIAAKKEGESIRASKLLKEMEDKSRKIEEAAQSELERINSMSDKEILELHRERFEIK